MKQLVLAPDQQTFKAALNYKLGLFLSAFTSALYLTGMLVLVGMVLNFMHLPGEHLVFVFALFLLSFLFFLQTGIAFVYVYARPQLAFLGAFSSLSIALACITFVFAFENWWGMYIMLVLTLPLLLLSFACVVGYFISGGHRHTTHRKFLYLNILTPYLFIMLLWLAYLVRHEVRQRRDARTAILLEMRITNLAIP